MTDAEYWATIAEIDASYFVLEQMQKRFDNRAPIVRMIDESTGFEVAQVEEAKAIVDRIKVLQAKLPPNDPHFINQNKESKNAPQHNNPTKK